MSIRINNPNSEQQKINDLNNNSKQTAREAAVGTRKGNKFKAHFNPAPITNVAATVAESLEEVTQLRSKLFSRLEDRKLTKGQIEFERQLKKIKKIKKLENIANIHQFKGNFAGEEKISKGKILEKAKDFFDDVMQQFAAIAEIIEEFESSGKDASEFYAAMEQLYDDNTQELRAGLNITEEAFQQSIDNNVGSLKDLRAEYIDNVVDYTTLEDTFKNLSEKHVGNNLSVAVDIQLKLLAADLQSTTPSSSKTNLQAIINDLAKLKIFANCHTNCEELVTRYSRTYNNEKLTTNDFLENMLSLVEKKWLTENDFIDFATKLNITNVQEQIFIVTQMLRAINDIPDNYFKNSNEKNLIIEIGSKALDGIINIEENPEQQQEDKSVSEDFGIIGEMFFDDLGIINKLSHKKSKS